MHALRLTIWAAAVLLAAGWGRAAEPPKLPDSVPAANAVLDGFAGDCAKNTAIAEPQRSAATAKLNELRADAARAAEAIPEALGLLYPAFRQALVDLGEEKMADATRVLREMAASKDAYLAAHAAFYLGRALVAQDRFEEALPLLQQVAVGEHRGHTLQNGEALFLLGSCQAQVLEREEAIRTLKRFLELYPTAAERMRIGAEHLIVQTQNLLDGSLVDVHDRMGWSHRRLTIEESGKPTQEGQDRIIAMLDKLIEEAEQREKSGGGGGGGGGGGQGSGSGPPSGNQAPSSPATRSALPEGEGRMGDLHQVNRGRAGDSWGNLPDKERAKVLNALKTRFPDRYRQLIEQYYKSFQEEPKR